MLKTRLIFLVAAIGALSFNVAVAQDSLGKKSKSGNSGSSNGQSTTRRETNSGSTRSLPPPSSDTTRSRSNQQREVPRPAREIPPPRGNTGDLGRPQTGNQDRRTTTTGSTGSSSTSGGARQVPPPRRNSEGFETRQDSGLGKKTRNTGSSGSSSTSGGVREVIQPGNTGGLGRGQRQDSGSLGRPDRLPSGTSDVFTKKNRDSKSGTVGYDNSHNVKSLGRPVAIGEVPRIENNRIRHEGFGENRIISIDNRYRNGYVFYNDRWCDNDFYYPYYGFNWYRGCDYVFSPFYYYGHLPGYISCTRITFGIFTWTQCNSRYDWSPPRYDNYGYGGQRAFDSAVFDIQRSFERGNMRSMSHLIPTRGEIEIDMENDNRYALRGDDFYDMMSDLVESTRTTDYRIENVYRDDDRATIVAIHEFRDPWGNRQSVRHTYGLRECGRDFEITYFRTDRY